MKNKILFIVTMLLCFSRSYAQDAMQTLAFLEAYQERNGPDRDFFDYSNSGRFYNPNEMSLDLQRQSDENAIRNLGQNYEMLSGQIAALQSGFDQLNSLLNLAGGAMELYGTMRTLDNQECAPDFQLGAGALMPSSCLGSTNSSADCSSCYEAAVERLQNVRRGMARMRCIYMNTRTFKEKAVSFGDNVAGLHGAMGLVWQGQRRGIEASYSRFTSTYDRKYADFIGSLHEALLAVSECENRFGTRDWYQRFGFMFEEIMKEKYKRTD